MTGGRTGGSEKILGVKGDDGWWIMDVSQLLLDPHPHTAKRLKLFLRRSGLENPRGNSMAGTRQIEGKKINFSFAPVASYLPLVGHALAALTAT